MVSIKGFANGLNNERFWRVAVEILSVDLSQYGVKEGMNYYDAGLLCTRADLRELKLGTKMIERSIQMAKEAGADFYKVDLNLLIIPKLMADSAAYRQLIGLYLQAGVGAGRVPGPGKFWNPETGPEPGFSGRVENFVSLSDFAGCEPIFTLK